MSTATPESFAGPLGPAELRYQARCQQARVLLDAERSAPASGHALLSALLACERALMVQDGTVTPAPAHAELELYVLALLGEAGR